MGCEFGQGFHFARPMDEQALLAYLVRQSRFGEQPQSHAA
jgi:EAL domain-containing protein (putative c-di-GMP-specific phosphodiesterase class I)